MPLPLLGLLGIGAAAGGISTATNAVSGLASKIPLIGPLISGVANGVGGMTSASLPGLFR